MSPARRCILSVSGQTLTAEESAFLRDANPFGLILMGRSCGSRVQVRRLVDDIWNAVQRPCLIFIDQEGGRVARLKAPEWPTFPAAGVYGALYDQNPDLGLEASRLGHLLLASELVEIGIHADCSPVADVRTEGAHDIVGDRAFHSDPHAVAALAGAAMEGLRMGGVAPVIKHLPGHGRALVDSHKELPRVTASHNEIARDFLPFEALRAAPMGMTAHIAYDALDPEKPATHSPDVISQVIRRRIGFDGLLMTDDLGMKALGGTLGERATKALSAGCDLALHCSGFVKDPDDILKEMIEVAEACGDLERDSLARAHRAEAWGSAGVPVDREEGWERFRALLAGDTQIA